MAVDVPAHLDDLKVRMDRLKVLYEQYFLGVEKQPPQVARREIEKLLDFLAKQNIGNTAIRFRYLGLLRRWKTYAERWDKILREIENGTYAPHRLRVERSRRLERERTTGRLQPAAAAEGERSVLLETPAAPPAQSAIPGMSEADLHALHERYVEARRRAGEAKPEVRYETLVSTLTKQLPDILQRNRCAEVSFDVAVRDDGRVVLKALPRR